MKLQIKSEVPVVTSPTLQSEALVIADIKHPPESKHHGNEQPRSIGRVPGKLNSSSLDK